MAFSLHGYPLTTLFVAYCTFCLLSNIPIVAPFSLTTTSATTSTPTSRSSSCFVTSLSFSKISSAAHDLLYQDQQDAMLRRAVHEEELLSRNRKSTKELLAPKLKAKPIKSGTGFGGASIKNVSNSDPAKRLAAEQAKVVHREGVLRINNVLTPQTTDKLRTYVLEQQLLAKVETERDPTTSRTYYGVENKRKNRCDLQLSLLRGGFAADKDADAGTAFESFALADALQELLGESGTLRHLYEALVTLEGEFYELAAVITNPGSNRQIVHPDLPYQPKAPLYVIFLALQDVTEDMGPTSFLLRTHTSEANDIFNSGNTLQKDDQLLNSDCRLSTLNKGDAVLFDARLLHCGNANDESTGQTRALFNFSFRNPQVTGNLGYKGSIRPGYEGALKLCDVSDALVAFKAGDRNPFAKYGNGIKRR